MDEPDFEWLMIDASHCKVHPHATGAKGCNQEMSRTKGDSIPRYTWPWMRMVCRSRVIITQGADADCQQALPLMAGIKANYLLADRGYDAQYILEQAKQQGMEPVIPPRKNRQQQRDYDRHLYKLRHLVENAFLHLKQWRGLATRYAKNTRSFLAALHIRCLMIWSKII
jgi:transposase